MPADILERAQFPVFTTDYKDVVATNVVRDEITHRLNVVHVADKLPAAQEKSVVVELKKLGVLISPGRQWHAWLNMPIYRLEISVAFQRPNHHSSP